jgi:hypothetical protein
VRDLTLSGREKKSQGKSLNEQAQDLGSSDSRPASALPSGSGECSRHPVRTVTRTERLAAAGVLGRYRRLILLGRLRAPLEAALRLVGPDCAYHLYGRVNPRKKGVRRRRDTALGGSS